MNNITNRGIENRDKVTKGKKKINRTRKGNDKKKNIRIMRS